MSAPQFLARWRCKAHGRHLAKCCEYAKRTFVLGWADCLPDAAKHGWVSGTATVPVSFVSPLPPSPQRET